MNISKNAKREQRARFGYKPDIQLDDFCIEVKYRPRDFRNLRSSLLELASWIMDDPRERGILLLVEPQFSLSRLSEEWHLAWQTLHPKVSKRLSLVVVNDGQYDGLPQNLKKGFRQKLDKLLNLELANIPSTATTIDTVQRRPQSFYDILIVLLNLWLLGKGSVTTKWLMEATGNSYPTVAKSLNLLEYCLKRHKNRQVELKYFQKEEWSRLVVNMGEFDKCIRLADRSGQPRSAEAHLKRLTQLKTCEYAIGGVLGAKQYYPDLDIVGTPRLDISIHNKNKLFDRRFIDQLDPGLKEVTDSLYPVNVVIHIISRPEPMFKMDDDGDLWADPVQCLLDLYDAKLDFQASEFKEYLITNRLKIS
ncbi:MAG: hypothetical protein P9L92_15670 [Candidatus Electryonea clarkiae]|nr:hypothetical protein [Candidatus Electryonea clarkiae]MDP8287263.1 hypothetical protein [Candidatus Electryonea clarkiae]